VNDIERTGEDSTRERVRVRSAGGVVVQRLGGNLLVAVMRSGYGTWVFPKGRIESGETAEDAARREVEEEVGLTELKLKCPLGRTEHEFDYGGTGYRKRVDWFLFEASAEAELRPDPAENVLDSGWFRPEKALSMLDHAGQRRLLRRALSSLKQRGRSGSSS